MGRLISVLCNLCAPFGGIGVILTLQLYRGNSLLCAQVFSICIHKCMCMHLSVCECK